MTKECKVIMSNDLVTVVKYGESEIQLPYSSITNKTVNVKYENGTYSIVEDSDEENVSDNFEQSIEDQVYSVIAYEDNMKTIIDENVNIDDE